VVSNSRVLRFVGIVEVAEISLLAINRRWGAGNSSLPLDPLHDRHRR
jgi:hypothetical protein